MVAHRSLAGRIKGLRYAVHLNDFKLAQRLRMALTVTSRHLDEPVQDEVARLVDLSGLWVRNVGDRHKNKRTSERYKGWSGPLSLKSVQDRARNVSRTIDFGGPDSVTCFNDACLVAKLVCEPIADEHLDVRRHCLSVGSPQRRQRHLLRLRASLWVLVIHLIFPCP